MYSELVYFDGAHFAHIAAYYDFVRLRRIRGDLAERYRSEQSGRERVLLSARFAAATCSALRDGQASPE
jgi:hypothetical protein